MPATDHPGSVEMFLFFLAGLKAAVPGIHARVRSSEIERAPSAEIGSGKELWEWAIQTPGGARLVTGMTRDQRMLVQRVLDGMLQDRAWWLLSESSPVNAQ